MNFVEKYLARYVVEILVAMSPAIKTMLETGAVSVYFKAIETDNPYDDIGAKFLLDCLGLPEPERVLDQDGDEAGTGPLL